MILVSYQPPPPSISVFDPNTTDPDELRSNFRNNLGRQSHIGKPSTVKIIHRHFWFQMKLSSHKVGAVVSQQRTTKPTMMKQKMATGITQFLKKGAVKWLDNICVTASSERYNTAVHFMNYLLDAQVGASNHELHLLRQPEPQRQTNLSFEEILGDDPSIYPRQHEVQEKLIWLTEVDDDAALLYDELWTAVKSSQ